MDWDNVYEDLKKVANRAADKLGQTATLAALQVKLAMAEKKLEEAYAALGKVAYEHFTDESDLSARVAAAVSRVNAAKRAVLTWQREIARISAGDDASAKALGAAPSASDSVEEA
ncbi:MAG: hypothetical protein IJW30_01890 [Clostridia bacterium]|nr:hypothetical protein [Clostridia bacterium]